jgi:membrane fusion protein
MSQPLFRREVLESRNAGPLGGISLAQPLSMRLLGAFAVIAAGTIALLLCCGSYTRRTTVVGHLVPTRGMTTLTAPDGGVVSRLDVAEGGHVVAGDTLAVIAVPRITIARDSPLLNMDESLRQRKEGLQSAREGQRQMMDAQAAGLASQLAAARRELQQIDAQLATRRQQLRIDEGALDRMRQLQAGGFVSLLQLQQQESTVLEQLARTQELQRQSSSMQRNITQLRQGLQELPGQRQAVEASAERDLAALSQERVEVEARGEYIIASPIDGIVATQLIKVGTAVQSGQPLLTLLPGEGELEAELLVPSRAIGFVAPGNPVLLRYQAFPYQKFGHQSGRIASVSRSALKPGEVAALMGANAGAEPLYRVTVSLARQAVNAYGRAEALKPGMLLEADIMGEARRLVEWVFEPLYSLSGRVGRS